MSDAENSPALGADDGAKSSGKGSSGPSSAQALNSPHAKQAKELADKAEKTLKSWIYLKGNKTEDALELYQQAANKYKMGKCYHEAGEMFTRMAPCHLKLDSKYEAANAYVDAANCYRKSSIEDAIRCMEQAVQIYTETGKFSTAAKLEKDLGDMLEEEGELEEACHHIQQAADYFDTEGQKSSANQCIVKLAHIYATREMYEEAQEKFEQAAGAALDDRLLKWGAKEFLFKALMCCIAKLKNIKEDVHEARDAYERYCDMDVHFPDSYEAKLIDATVKAIESGDIKAFTTALRDYDGISKLDQWKTTIFLRIRKRFEESLTQMPDWT